MKRALELGLSGPDLLGIARAALDRGLVGSGAPAAISIDGKRRRIQGADWIEEALGKCRTYFVASWPDHSELRIDRDRIVKTARPGFDLGPREVLARIEAVPFTLCSSPPLYFEWRNGSLGERYVATSFSDLHWDHGWACAFRGAGHDHLTSRRWLEYGPWRLVRGANDTSLVQFHDLEADPATALPQAKPGHERMGISDVGGFIWSDYVPQADLRGTYHPAKRQLEIVVHGREVGPREMLDAAAARLYQVLGPEQPLEAVAYVFMEEHEARRHLHELWLHGLECWAIVRGKEVRLDAEYAPEPSPPEWVRAVEQRSA